jgi:hypothetical protein
MTQNFRFSAFESEVIYPYSTFDHILDNCKLMIDEDEGFLEETNIFTEATPECLKLQIKIDQETLPDELIRKIDDLNVYVLLRDVDGFKNFEVIYTAELKTTKYQVIDIFQKVPSNFLVASTQLILLLAEKSDSNAFERLAVRKFKFTDITQALSFPKVFRSPDEFEQAGFYGSAPFAVKWIGEDLDKPINQLLEVWLNKKHELALQRFGASKASLPKAFMASAILQEIFHFVIVKTIQSNNFETTSGITVLKILSELGITKDHVVSIADRADFRSILNTWVMRVIKLEEGFKNDYS